jgi:hypothetical protein
VEADDNYNVHDHMVSLGFIKLLRDSSRMTCCNRQQRQQRRANDGYEVLTNKTLGVHPLVARQLADDLQQAAEAAKTELQT